MENSGIISIKVSNLYPHPDNPRKNIGDVTELAESVKKGGIMQNLTVIPLSALDEEPSEQPDADKVSLLSDFHVLIGHRRLAAAKMAGLEEVPCKIISKISRKEQVGIMLEENMQREDLTIYEQAQGFQLMLDLGETEDSIAEKTGFSKTTIKRRLNIAKLNQEELEKKEKDPSFQLTLTDLYELEKVEDVELRDKILKEATDSRTLVSRAQYAVKEAEREKRQKQLIPMLEEKGVKKAPKGTENEMYSNKWDEVTRFDLDEDVPGSVDLKNEDNAELYWLVYYRSIRVIKKKAKVKKELTPEEIKQKEIEKNKKTVKAILKDMNTRRKEFIQSILDGKIGSDKKENELREEIWKHLVSEAGYLTVSLHELKRFFSNEVWKLSEEENQELCKKIEALSISQQMLILLHHKMENPGDIINYQGHFVSNIGSSLEKGYKILENYGWFYQNDDEKNVLNGTLELYEKE